jgi:hypothetical protein
LAAQYSSVQNKLLGDLDAFVLVLTDISSSKITPEQRAEFLELKTLCLRTLEEIKKLNVPEVSLDGVTLNSFLDTLNFVLGKWLQLSGVGLIGSYVIAAIVILSFLTYIVSCCLRHLSWRNQDKS